MSTENADKLLIVAKAQKGMLAALALMLKRELVLSVRRGQELANPLVFFALVVLLFPLGVSPEPDFLANAAAGVVWVAALLATMLSLDGLFRSDYDDGSLENLVLSSQPLYLLVLVKLLVAWATTALPLIVMSPLLATMMHLPSEYIGILALSLLVGTPTLMFIGGIGAALTVSLRAGGVLISLLILPLTIPVLIFGTGVVTAFSDGLPVGGYLAIMAALLMMSLTLAPFACAAALKMSVSN